VLDGTSNLEKLSVFDLWAGTERIYFPGVNQNGLSGIRGV
jgi:hypothetical protein